MKNTRKLVLLGLYVSLALALNLFERTFIVPLTVMPGAKLGLSNIITLTILLSIGFKEAFIVLLTRVAMGAMFGGGAYTMLYSLSGGLLSLLFMHIISFVNRDKLSEIGISLVGAFFHNIGQIGVAAVVINNMRIFSYLPILFTSAIVTGIFVGYVTKFLIKVQVVGRLTDGFK